MEKVKSFRYSLKTSQCVKAAAQIQCFMFGDSYFSNIYKIINLNYGSLKGRSDFIEPFLYQLPNCKDSSFSPSLQNSPFISFRFSMATCVILVNVPENIIWLFEATVA